MTLRQKLYLDLNENSTNFIIKLTPHNKINTS